MKFRPSFRALSVGMLLLIVILYSALVVALYLIGVVGSYLAPVAAGLLVATVLVVAYLFGIRLVVLASRKLVLGNVMEVFSTMSIDFHSAGHCLILDRSGIETKVSSIGFLSLVGVKKGKKGARDYLTSVIKKYINYRFIKEFPNV